jgi:FtsP/CotA-like multicopper oxidase with cupredoxin domain
MNRKSLLSGAACATTLPLSGFNGTAARAAVPRRQTVDKRILQVNGKAATVFGLLGLPQPLIQPGEERGYRFPVGAGGTCEQAVRVTFDAVNPARQWAFHCHHLYHMASGMMTTLAYEGA